jgi:methyl-accepting chemotaxis protein
MSVPGTVTDDPRLRGSAGDPDGRVVAADPDAAEPAIADQAPVDTSTVGHAYAQRILVVAGVGSVAALAAVAACAVLAARVGSMPVHPLALAMWGLGASVSGVLLAALATDPEATHHATPRRTLLGSLLLAALLVCTTGVVTSADGVAGPAWVLFLPIVVIVAAVLGAVPGLVTGAAAAGGTYTAAVLSHTLSVAGIGRLIIILPVFPALGLSTGSLSGAAHAAARAAREQRSALQHDIAVLSAMLDAVAAGDLTATPDVVAGRRPRWSDPATERLAVVLTDTLLALRRLVGRLAGAGEAIVSSAAELAASAAAHVDAVETQAVAVSQTTSTIDQLAATATAIAEVAARVSQCATESREDADAGFAAVAASVDAGQRLAERAGGLADAAETLRGLVEQVGVSTRVMDELSRRTTMLALTAGIEAASAGEASSGFRNVADEVRALAQRAHDATAGITAIVGQLREEVEATADAARQGAVAVTAGVERQADVEAALQRIGEMIDHTSRAAREITGATAQQRAAADDVVRAMASVTHSSTQARVATARHSESAERLRDLARHVAGAIGVFRLPAEWHPAPAPPDRRYDDGRLAA